MVAGDGVRYNFEEQNGKKLYQNIKQITFRDSYGQDDGDYYHQQRWNSFDVAGRRRVCDVLDELKEGCDDEFRERLYKLFNIEKLLDKELILLSSGEMRKFQLTSALLSTPKLLIIDNPFIGLDAPSRDMLQDVLSDIASDGRTQLIIVVSRSADIPRFTTHIIPIEEMKCRGKIPREEYIESLKVKHIEQSIAMINALDEPSTYQDIAVEMRDVAIAYGTKQILKGVNLTIRKGESWVISGRNGAGKSTLLSLVCADNPQSYRCDISLFGRKRGSGESIWDIKRRIGYVSPEMHRSFNVSMPAVDIVASGLYDTIGLYGKINEPQRAMSLHWMEIFNISHLANRNFIKLSSGEQRIILLCRAFVKNPELLILDEPLHGLDENYRSLAVAIIDAFARKESKTTIIVTHYIDELPIKITSRFNL